MFSFTCTLVRAVALTFSILQLAICTENSTVISSAQASLQQPQHYAARRLLVANRAYNDKDDRIVISKAFSVSSGARAKVTFCSKREAEGQAKALLGTDTDNITVLACQDAMWMEEFRDKSSSGQLTFLEVDCNFGYTAAQFFDIFAPGSDVGTARVASILEKKQPLNPICGMCNECKASKKAAAKADAKIRYVCFEPDQAKFGMVQSIRDDVMTPQLPIHWDVHHQPESGIELDSYLAKGGISLVQLLSLGPSVLPHQLLKGAQRAMTDHRILMLRFWYRGPNSVGGWNKGQLQSVALTMFRLGYVCYVEGNQQFARLTACWSNYFENIVSARILCIHDGHVIRKFVDAASIVDRAKAAARAQAGPGGRVELTTDDI